MTCATESGPECATCRRSDRCGSMSATSSGAESSGFDSTKGDRPILEDPFAFHLSLGYAF